MNVRIAIVLLCLLASSVTAHAQYAWRLILPRTAYTVQVNPLDPQKVYVGNRYDQLWRSYDGGNAWEVSVMTEFSADEYMSSMIVSSADTNVLLYGGFNTNGIKRSDDGGRTARRVLRPNTGTMYFISEAIVEDPSDPRILYAVRGRPFYQTTVYKSTNIGVTWDSISIMDSSQTNGLCTIAIRPDSTNILFVGAKLGTILRSDDAGRTFRRVPVLGDKLSIFDDSEIPKIVFSPLNPMVGYAVVAFSNPLQISGNGGLLKTTNGGESWDRVAYADTSLWAVEVRASSLGTDDVFVGGFKLGPTNSPVKGDSLVARSLDGGTTWTRFSNITWPPNEDGISIANVWVMRYNKPSNKLYMATNCGLYIFDEPTGVEGDVRAHASLHSTIADGVLRVVDTDASAFANGAANAWTLFNVQGAAVATGRVESTDELMLNLSRFASGAYVMTWGTELKFRTVSFIISR